MRKGRGIQGYTIVEVLIFLAVSGFMFILAVVFISGKQSRGEFRQGINDLNTQIRQVVNDVSNGFYPSTNSLKCSAGDGGQPSPSAASGTDEGTNKGCVFIGKVIQFGTGEGDAVDPTAYSIYTVVGRQFSSDESSLPPTSFAEADPIAVDNASVSLTEHKQLQWGLKVRGMFSVSESNPVGAIGVFGSFGTHVNSHSLASGSQSDLIFGLPGSQLSQPATNTKGQITALSSLASIPNPNLIICVDNGKGLYGTLTLGGTNGQRLTTDITTENSPTGVCSHA